MKIWVVETASKAQAFQIIRYQNSKRVIVQHIGSADNDEKLKAGAQLILSSDSYNDQ